MKLPSCFQYLQHPLRRQSRIVPANSLNNLSFNFLSTSGSVPSGKVQGGEEYRRHQSESSSVRIVKRHFARTSLMIPAYMTVA